MTTMHFPESNQPDWDEINAQRERQRRYIQLSLMPLPKLRKLLALRLTEAGKPPAGPLHRDELVEQVLRLEFGR